MTINSFPATDGTVQNFIESLRSLVNEMVEEKLDELKPLYKTGTIEANDEIFVDAERVAVEVFGLDVSTPATKSSAIEHVLHLARTKQIPSAKLNKFVRFPLKTIKRELYKQVQSEVEDE